MDRIVNKGAVEIAMGKAWRLSSRAIFVEVSLNIFTVSFTTQEDKKKVENGCP